MNITVPFPGLLILPIHTEVYDDLEVFQDIWLDRFVLALLDNGPHVLPRLLLLGQGDLPLVRLLHLLGPVRRNTDNKQDAVIGEEPKGYKKQRDGISNE